MQHDPMHLSRDLRERLGQAGREFLADILGAETRRRPANVDALADLAHVLTRLGRLEEGLDADRRLARLVPEDPAAHYNLACSLALLQRTDEAFEALERAIGLGYDDLDHLVKDEDLRALRPHPRFQELLRGLGTSRPRA